jgi:succinyl-CoA synthetase beta subunit
MLGTNAEESRKMLQASSLNISLVEDLADVAEAIRAPN